MSRQKVPQTNMFLNKNKRALII